MDTAERVTRLEERLDANLMRIDQTAIRIEKEVRDFRAEMQSSLNSTRLLIIGTAISSVIGIWSLNSSMLSGMLGAFDSGRETAKMNSDAGQQAAESLKRSTELIERLEAMSASKAKDSQTDPKK